MAPTRIPLQDFPYNLEPVLLGRELEMDKGPVRRLIMYK